MFSIYYISHHRLDKKRLEKNDKAKLIVQIVTFTMILFAAVSGFTFFDTARNTALNDYNVMSKFVLCATAVCEILFKIGAAQPNCHSMVSYLMLPIKKRDLFNSRTLIDCFQLYNFYCFSFFSAYFVRLAIAGELTIVQTIVYSIAVLSTSFLMSELIKYFKTFKAHITAVAFTLFCVCVAETVYLINTDEVFSERCVSFFSNIYICLTIIAIQSFLVFRVGYAQMTRQLDQTTRANNTIRSINGWSLDRYTKLLLTFIIRSKTILGCYIAYPIMGIIVVIISKVGLLPQGFDFTLIGYGAYFYGGILMLNPLPTKFSLYLDGMYLRDKDFLKPLMNSYIKINFIINFVYLLIIFPIFKDYCAIVIFLFNVSLMPLIGNLAIASKQCVRLDIFNAEERPDRFSTILMFAYLGSYTFVWLISTISNRIGFYTAAAISFISILFLIIRKVWINKLSELFIENHYEILEDVRS